MSSERLNSLNISNNFKKLLLATKQTMNQTYKRYFAGKLMHLKPHHKGIKNVNKTDYDHGSLASRH